MVKFENAFRLLTSFDPKNVTSRTGVSNWPPLIQKHDCHQQEDPTDHLWSKNVTVTQGGSNWPALIQKRYRYLQGGPTDLRWSKNVSVTHRGVQLTCFDPKTLPLLTGGSNWPFRCLDGTRWKKRHKKDLCNGTPPDIYFPNGILSSALCFKICCNGAGHIYWNRKAIFCKSKCAFRFKQ